MSEKRPETLVIVERDSGPRIETRELVREGEKAYLIFARSDGTECRVEIDSSEIRPVLHGRIEVEFLYRGAIQAPDQEASP